MSKALYDLGDIARRECKDRRTSQTEQIWDTAVPSPLDPPQQQLENLADGTRYEIDCECIQNTVVPTLLARQEEDTSLHHHWHRILARAVDSRISNLIGDSNLQLAVSSHIVDVGQYSGYNHFALLQNCISAVDFCLTG